MKINLDQEWCIRKAREEGNTDVAAGILALDTVFGDELETASSTADQSDPSIVSGRSVSRKASAT